MLTEEQLALRRKGITATDMTKIMGVSKYGGAIDVLLDKQGCPAPFDETERVKWGNYLEEPIRKDYGERHGVEMLEPGTLKHPTEEWALATPDAIVMSKKTAGGILRGWECKTHTGWLSHLYGEPGTDELPEWEAVQCHWNIWVARAFYGIPLERWDLTVFMDGLPVDYVIYRDEELESVLVETGRAFWFDNVIGGEEVEPDGSESFSKHLRRKWRESRGEVVQADAEGEELMEDLRNIREEKKRAETEEERVKQCIQLVIGDAEALNSALGKLTWKYSKESTSTAYSKVVKELLAATKGKNDALHQHVKQQIEKHTKPKKRSRPFVAPKAWNR